MGQLGVVGDHDDQAIGGDLAQQVHHLYRGRRVQGAGRLIRQQDLGIVDQGAGDRYALHLATRELVGALVHMICQAHRVQRRQGPLTPLRPGDPGQGQRQLDVGQHALVRNEVVSLEDEADAVAAVSVPVPVLVVPGGDAVDDEVPGVKAVQPADDVEHRGLAATGLAQDRDELVVPEGDADRVQGSLGERGGAVGLGNGAELEHGTFRDSEVVRRQASGRGLVRERGPALRRRAPPGL